MFTVWPFVSLKFCAFYVCRYLLQTSKCPLSRLQDVPGLAPSVKGIGPSQVGVSVDLPSTGGTERKGGSLSSSPSLWAPACRTQTKPRSGSSYSCI